MSTSPKTCLIVGGRGYLGGELRRYLPGAGWRVLTTTRRPRESDDVLYTLGGDFPRGALEGVDAIVHCAYDFGPVAWDEIYRKNVAGTVRLLDQAKRAGIKTFVTISSISAFPGCRSLYGKAKLLIEEATLAAGGMVLRPGLIYGGSDQGMYGRLATSVKKGKLVPLLAGSPCTQYLVHVDDLNGLIEALLSGRIPPPSTAWTVAHPEPWPLRKLLTVIARGRPIHFIPVPWPMVWLALKMAEGAGLALAFKSDSVQSIVYQNPHPDLSHIREAGVSLRQFQPPAK